MAAESRRRNGAALVARLEDRLDHLHAPSGTSRRDASTPRAGREAGGAGRTRRRRRARDQQPARGHLRATPNGCSAPSRTRTAASRSRRSSARRSGSPASCRDLMQFARPPRPNPHRTAAADLLIAVRDDLAARRGREAACGSKSPVRRRPPFVRCDLAQLRHALVCRGAQRDRGRRTGGLGAAAVVLRPTTEFVVRTSRTAGRADRRSTANTCSTRSTAGGRPAAGAGWGCRPRGGSPGRTAATCGTSRPLAVRRGSWSRVPRSIALEFSDRQSA